MPAEDAAQTLGQRVKARRDERRMTQKALARKVGVSESKLSRLLSGDTLGKAHEAIKVLEKIEAALGFEEGELRALLDIPRSGALKVALSREATLSPKAKRALSDLVDELRGGEPGTVSNIGDRRPRPSPTGAKRAAAEGGKARPSAKAQDELAQHAEDRKPQPKQPRRRKKPET